MLKVHSRVTHIIATISDDLSHNSRQCLHLQKIMCVSAVCRSSVCGSRVESRRTPEGDSSPETHGKVRETVQTGDEGHKAREIILNIWESIILWR